MNIHVHPARRLAEVQEYYFSRKLKEVARLRAAGHDIVSWPSVARYLPPSPAHHRNALSRCTRTCGPRLPAHRGHAGVARSHGPLLSTVVWCSTRSDLRDPTAHRFERGHPPHHAGFCSTTETKFWCPIPAIPPTRRSRACSVRSLCPTISGRSAGGNLTSTIGGDGHLACATAVVQLPAHADRSPRLSRNLRAPGGLCAAKKPGGGERQPLFLHSQ